MMLLAFVCLLGGVWALDLFLFLLLAALPKPIPVYSWERQSIPEIGRGIQCGTEILLRVTHIWIT
jgi:hypothetical protein